MRKDLISNPHHWHQFLKTLEKMSFDENILNQLSQIKHRCDQFTQIKDQIKKSEDIEMEIRAGFRS